MKHRAKCQVKETRKEGEEGEREIKEGERLCMILIGITLGNFHSKPMTYC